MTCVAAYVHPETGDVAMAADSGTTFGDTIMPLTTSKVRAVKLAQPGAVALFGIAGLGASIEYAEYVGRFNPPGPDEDLEWAKALGRGFGDFKRERDFPPDAVQETAGLLAYNQRVYVLTSYDAVEVVWGYAAIGCGADYAIGAMHAYRELRPGHADAMTVAVAGVEAAVQWDPHCIEPITVELIRSGE